MRVVYGISSVLSIITDIVIIIIVLLVFYGLKKKKEQQKNKDIKSKNKYIRK